MKVIKDTHTTVPIFVCLIWEARDGAQGLAHTRQVLTPELHFQVCLICVKQIKFLTKTLAQKYPQYTDKEYPDYTKNFYKQTVNMKKLNF